MSLIRTFLAVDSCPAVRRRAQALQDELRANQARASWTRSEKLHLTLRFLGDVEVTRIPAVIGCVAQATASLAPFRIRFRQVGAFPSSSRPRTIWIGVDEGKRQLVELRRAVEVALSGLGIPRERRAYSPHLTIARLRGAGSSGARLLEWFADHHDFEAGSCDVAEVLIMASHLDRPGAPYEILSQAPLAGTCTES